MRLSIGFLLIEYISKRFAVNKRKCHQILVLVVTFFVYTAYHMSRRSLSIAKPLFNHKNCSIFTEVYNENQPANNSYWCNWAPFNDPKADIMLGWLDTSYLASYAIFMFVAGYLAERCDLRYFLSASLTVCGIFCILFGIARPLKIHNYYYYVAIQVLTGVAQTTGWPAVVAAVGNWFGHTKTGLIFGIWSWHTSVGNIVGAAVAGAFIDHHWGLSFIVPGIICIGMAVFVFLFLIPCPQSVGLSSDDNHLSDKSEKSSIDSVECENKAISFLGAFKIPGVIEFAVCLFFSKLVCYTFLYWLPQFINESIEVSASQSAYLSISFDIGGAVGAILVGFVADITNASAITCLGFLIGAIPSLFAFYEWGSMSMVSNQCLQFVAGMFVNGPYSLITTAVSADLATKVKSKSALATVSAIIDGTGSIGAALGPAIAEYLNGSGPVYVFYMVMIADFCAIISLLRTGINEFKRLRSQRRAKRKENQINRFSYKL